MIRAVHPLPPVANHHLARWHRRAVVAVGVGLLATGAGWLGVHYLAGAGAGLLPHPLEAPLLRLHGLAAFAGLFMFGVIAAAHLPQGWRLSRRNRWAHQRATGLALCVFGAALALSGYLLYYFAPEALRPALGWIHSGIGVAMAIAFALHRRRFGHAGAVGSKDKNA
jgi:hypothetical protein